MHAQPARQVALGLHRAGVQRRSPDLGEQLGEPTGGDGGDLGVDPALVAQRCLGVQVEPGGRRGDRRRVPPGELEHHVGGRGGDLRGGTAHDPRDADDPVVGIDDHAVGGTERALDAVQRHQLLALARPAGGQRPTGEQRTVVGVVGLAQLEHHVVGHVHHVVDGSHAGRDQTLGHPLRRRSQLHPGQHPGEEPATQVGGLDVHTAQAVGRFARLVDGEGGHAERHPLVRGQVPCDAHDAERVGSVRQRVELVHHVARDAERLGDRGPRGGCVGQDQDPGVVVTQLHLTGRAEHAVALLAAQLAPGDLHAAGHHGADGRQWHQVTGDHVRRAAADLQRHAVAGIHVDQADAVGVGVLADLQHAGDDDAVEALAEQRDRLELHAQLGQLRGDLVGLALDGSELTEPGEEDLHRVGTTGCRGVVSGSCRRFGTIRTGPGSGCRW